MVETQWDLRDRDHAGVCQVAGEGCERLRAMHRASLEVVELIAGNANLERVLARIAALVEEHSGGVRASILVLRDGRLYHAAGGRLPLDFVSAMDGFPIGGGNGSGQAPFWDLRPLACEIAVDPRWEDCRAAALIHQLTVCRSSPIISGTGEVLGALAAYSGPDRSPIDGALIESACRLAAVSIEQRNLIEDLAHQAGHDPLTHLPNRYLFEDRLQQAIRMAGRGQERVGLLSIDLDRFGAVNDLLGHRAGDALLEQVARRLEGCLRKSDTLARTGGDEFTLVLPALSGDWAVVRVAEKLCSALAGESLKVQGHELFVTASFGASLYPDDAPDAAGLEKNATDAMYRAKAQGGNGVQAFTAEMSRASRERLETETLLRKALEREELRLDYQPQYSLRTGALAGAEALLRWHNPVMGAVSPGVFIPVAEESGLIIPIGAWVMREACRQRVKWGAAMADSRVAVNVSALQFARADFISEVEKALAETGIDPQLLELELTETIIMRDVDQTARKMACLRELGLSISMDDFGTGYSSLSCLQRLPFETVKIDQSFVREIRLATDRPPLIQSMIGLTRALKKRVVAEGVETAEQLQALMDMGCEIGQGYLLGRPMPPGQLRAHQPPSLAVRG